VLTRGTCPPTISCSRWNHPIGCREQRANAKVDEIDVGEAQHDLRVEGQSLVDETVDDVEQRL
jgi:hypothetical protein